jgi:hypothetical protein
MVEELQTNYGSAYVVYLEDKTKLKILKVSPEGEMETLVDMVKDL